MKRRRRGRLKLTGVVLTGLCMLALAPSNARPQERRAPRNGTVAVTPGADYDANAVHELFFGRHYRDLWTTPIRVPVLNLDTFAGGLTPLRRGGGQQTKSLRFRAADGREYAFRSVDKDPAAVLPPELRETLVASILQDQISAGHPTGALVVAPLLEAVGVLHPGPQLFVMPDDPALGEFRAEFAGMLGMIEERPDEGADTVPSFAGATRVVGTERLLERLEQDGERVDERAFLTARLVDLFLGDWDRHRDQWRWAAFGEGPEHLWQPIPRDRDQAFAMLDGLLLNLARRENPQLVSFGTDYPGIVGLTWNGRELDRRLLVGLERPAWDSIAGWLQSRLTGDVISGAVRQLPPEHYAVGGAALEHALRLRRDGIREVAGEFYALLARAVDVHLTDLADAVVVDRAGDGTVEVRAEAAGRPRPHYARRFQESETGEIRLYLHGGRDSVVVTGTGGDAITLRIIGGGGDDVFIDSSRGGKARFYDARGSNVVAGERGGSIDRRPFVPAGEQDPAHPLRDWGSLTRPIVWMGGSPDLGVLIGGGLERFGYGFRKQPYSSHIALRVAYATAAQTFHAQLDARLHRENSPIYANLRLRASGLEILRFHGFGNDTELSGADEFYEVEQQQYAIEPELVVPISPAVALSLQPVAQFSHTRLDTASFIGITRPYGIGDFGQLGARAALTIDRRDRERAASRGFLLRAGAGWFPAILDVESAFGDLHAEANAFLTFGPTLALRAGGRSVLGDYPFHEAAYIGDAETVRLGRKQRFGGDAEVHGTAELRQKIARATIVIPADIGLHALGDIGRVYFEDEESDTWHEAFGGGFWLAFLRPENTLSVSIARSDEKTGLYVTAGFAF